MDKFGYIYMTTNNINGMKYIGQHKSEIFDSSYKGSGDLLRPDLMKYKRMNFSVELLEWCSSQEELDEREKYWISYYNATKSTEFYNKAPGGLNSFKGQHHTEATKQYLSKIHKEMATPEFKQHMSKIKLETNARKGTAFWVNNGTEEHLLVESEYNDLLKKDSSYVIGRLPDMIYMYKNNDTIKIHKSEMDKYLSEGYVIGKSKKLCENIAKSRRHSLWYYKDLEFPTSDLLTEYLRVNGYPEITYSTVVNICNGELVKKYKNLCPFLKRVCLD